MPEITVPVVTDDNVKAEILKAYELAVQQIDVLEDEIKLGHEEFNALAGLTNEYKTNNDLGNLAADYIRAYRKIETTADAMVARAIWFKMLELVK